MLQKNIENTCEPADFFREELVDLQLYYSRTLSQEDFKHVFQGIRTIAPRGKLPPGQGWSFGQGQGYFQGWGATRQLPQKKIATCLGLGFGLGLFLGQGAVFLGGNCPRTNKRRAALSLQKNEELAETVQKLKKYKDKNVAQNAWKEVADQLDFIENSRFFITVFY